MAVAAIIGLVGAGMSVYTAIDQSNKAKEIERAAGNRPQTKIPEAEQQALFLAKLKAARNELPGQDLIEAKMRESTAQGLNNVERAATSSSDVLSSLPNLIANEQKAKRDLGIAGAQAKDVNENNLVNQLARYGMWENKVFQENEVIPYNQAMASASAMKGASMQNLNNGINSLQTLAGNKMIADAIKDQTNTVNNTDLTSIYANLGMAPVSSGGQYSVDTNGRIKLNTNLLPEQKNNFGSGAYNSWGSGYDFGNNNNDFSAMLNQMYL